MIFSFNHKDKVVQFINLKIRTESADSTGRMRLEPRMQLTIRLFSVGAGLAVEMLVSDLLRANIQITPGLCGSGSRNEMLDVISKETFHYRR